MKSVQTLNVWKEILVVFIPSWLPESVNQKTVDRIRETYIKKLNDKDIYDLQLKAISLIKDIETSHLLAINDVVVKPLIQEYKDLKCVLTECLKRINALNFSEVKEHKEKFNSIKISEIATLLHSDLIHLNNELSLNLDIKMCMDFYKST